VPPNHVLGRERAPRRASGLDRREGYVPPVRRRWSRPFVGRAKQPPVKQRARTSALSRRRELFLATEAWAARVEVGGILRQERSCPSHSRIAVRSGEARSFGVGGADGCEGVRLSFAGRSSFVISGTASFSVGRASRELRRRLDSEPERVFLLGLLMGERGGEASPRRLFLVVLLVLAAHRPW